jgi:hypothetical protein
VRDLAVDDRQHRDVAVTVGGSSRDDAALRGVFEHDNARGLIVVDGQVIAMIEEECGAIQAIRLGYGLAPFDMARVARDRNDVLDDDALGQQVEEVLTVRPGLSFQAWIPDPAAAHTRRSTGCDRSTQACLTGPTPLTAMTAGSAASARAPS